MSLSDPYPSFPLFPGRSELSAVRARAGQGGVGSCSLDTPGKHRVNRRRERSEEDRRRRARERRETRKRLGVALARAYVESAREAGAAGDQVAAVEWKRLAGELRDCGRPVVLRDAIEEGGCGAVVAHQGKTCKQRLCPWCSRERARRLARLIKGVVDNWKNPVYLVLTLVNGTDLWERDRHLRACMSRLWRHPSWRAHFRGAFWFWETTYNASAGTWHVHLNIIGDLGRYWPVDQILALWRELTGDSFVGWIKTAWDVREAVKYCAKLTEIVEDPALVREFLESTKGRRFWDAVGSARGSVRELESALAGQEEADRADVEAHATGCPACGHVGSMRGVVDQISGRLRRVDRDDCLPFGHGWYKLPPGYDIGPPGPF